MQKQMNTVSSREAQIDIRIAKAEERGGEIPLNQAFAEVKSELRKDAVRAELRLQEDQETRLSTIRAVLIEGEESGISDRSPEDIVKSVIERRQENG